LIESEENVTSKPAAPVSAPSRWIRSLLKSLGPGIITGAADDDPSGIATYSVAGAQLGTKLLWTALLTWPLMAAVQMMCARIGMVTGQGLAGNFNSDFQDGFCSSLSVSLLIANTINIAADLAGMADAAAMLSGINSHWFVIVFALLISWATVRLQYQQIANVLKWLVLVLFAYPVTAFVVGADWGQVLRATLVPSMPHTKTEWATLVAILGTTISPYLFFWQASEEVEEEKSAGQSSLAQRRGATPEELELRNIDVGVGAFFSNAVMFFIILTTAITLNKHGIVNIETSRQAARSPAPICRQLRRNPVHPGYCRRRIPRHPHVGRIGRIRLCRNIRVAPGLEQETQAGTLVLRSHSGLNRRGRRAGLHRHQSGKGALLDRCHQRIAGALSSGRNPHRRSGQEADAGPAEFAPRMGCRGSHHDRYVRRRCRDVRRVGWQGAAELRC
jgi:hypothetical protein